MAVPAVGPAGRVAQVVVDPLAVAVAPVVVVVVVVGVAPVAVVGPAVGLVVAAIRRLGGSRCSTARALRSGPNSPSSAMRWISAASNSASAMVAGAVLVVVADGDAEPVSDTLGLLEEAMQLARDLGYRVREEPLGELAGGVCAVGGQRQILLNAAHPSSQRLDALLDVLAADADVGDQPVSHLLESRLRKHRSGR